MATDPFTLSSDPALASMALLFGVDQKLDAACAATFRPRRSTVAYVQESCEGHAAVYASMTNRRVVGVRGLTDLWKVADLAVVVCTFDLLTPEFLDQWTAFSLESECAPGLVAAASPERLLLQVLLRATAAVYSSSSVVSAGRPLWIDVLPLNSFGVFEEGRRRLLGRDAQRADILSALSVGSGFLRVVTTSDGIDAPLNRELILCPMRGSARSHSEGSNAAFNDSGTVGSGRCPRCVISNLCHRLSMNVRDAMCSPLIVAPSAISTRVLLWQTCQGVLTGSLNNGDQWGLGRHLAVSGSIGALVTTCDCVTSNLQITEDLAFSIACGQEVGFALAEHIKRIKTTPLSHRLFLFGDPEVRSSPDVASSMPKLVFNDMTSERLKLASTALYSTPAAELRAIQCAVQASPQHSTGYRDRVMTLFAPASRYPNGELLRDPEFQDAVLRHMIHRGWVRWIDDWHDQAAVVDRLDSATLCRYCRGTRDVKRVALAVPGAVVRKSTMCRRCGPTEDVPLTCDIGFMVSEEGRCVVEGSFGNLPWLAYLAVMSDLKEETRIHPWPKSPSGEPAKEMTLVEPWPTGPLRIGLFVMADTWYQFTQPYHPEHREPTRWLPGFRTA